ncbi:hypothetical protein CPC08DRAFT_728521 [Agrocybe pediades]|nr:hypothetical protein CPC08DRAFT_728521 [Agrocybe pediades]
MSTDSSLSSGTAGGMVTMTAIAALTNARSMTASSKKVVVDAQIFVGSGQCESLLGALSYFNKSELPLAKSQPKPSPNKPKPIQAQVWAWLGFWLGFKFSRPKAQAWAKA